MGLLKGTVFYQFNPGGLDPTQGWSESYLFPQGDYQVAMQALDSINTARLAFACSTVTAQRLRVSDITIRGDALIQAPTTNQGQSPGSTHEPIEMYLLVRFSAENRYFSNRFLHGIPESQFLTGFYQPQPIYLTAVNTWAASVQANTILRVKNKTPPPVGFILVTPQRFVIERAHVRHVGRPFGLSVGRRKIR